MDSESEDLELPYCILDDAASAKEQLIPEKSRARYEKEYDAFEEWCKTKQTLSLKEEVFLAYFSHLSKSFVPSTLWSKFSMLKLSLKLRKNVDISRYYQLISFIKRKNVGFRPKKSKVLEKNDIEKFLIEAPNHIYLMNKVVIIFGIAGACRRAELANLLVSDIEEREDILVVRIQDTKNHALRSFVVCDPNKDGVSYIYLYRKYKSLRPANTPHQRLFLSYQNGKCSRQVVGINTFGKIPSNIASFLRLPNPENYTGHCFRRSSATMLANTGANVSTLKRHGGWKSSMVAESYVEESVENKRKIATRILQTDSVAVHDNRPNQELEGPSSSTSVVVRQECTSTAAFQRVTTNKTFSKTEHLETVAVSVLTLQNATNCTFNFHVLR